MIFLLDKNLKTIGTIKENELLEGVEVSERNIARTLSITALANKPRLALFEGTRYIFVPIKNKLNEGHLYRAAPYTLNGETMTITGVEKFYDDMQYMDYMQDYRPTNQPLTTVINKILENSPYTLDYIHPDLSTKNFTGNFYYTSRLEALSSLFEAVSFELDVVVAIDNKSGVTGEFVRLSTQFGKDSNVRYSYGRNISEIVMETNPLDVVTAVLGRGKGEENDEGNYGRRIMFTDEVWSVANGDPLNKPAGQNYLLDANSNSVNGLVNGKPRIQIVTFEEIDTPAALLQASYEWLMENNRPKVELKTTVFETGELELGDTVTVVRSDMDIIYQTRVFKLTRNLLNYDLSTVEFGDKLTKSFGEAQSDLKGEITGNILGSVNDALNDVIINADGSRINYGENEPTVKKVGDMWYEYYTVDGIRKTRLRVWNGSEWEIVLDDAIFDQMEQQINDAVGQISGAVEAAQGAVDKANQIEQEMNVLETDFADLSGVIYPIKDGADNVKALRFEFGSQQEEYGEQFEVSFYDVTAEERTSGAAIIDIYSATATTNIESTDAIENILEYGLENPFSFHTSALSTTASNVVTVTFNEPQNIKNVKARIATNDGVIRKLKYSKLVLVLADDTEKIVFEEQPYTVADIQPIIQEQGFVLDQINKDLTEVKQTADGLTVTVSSHTGDISQLKQTSLELTQTVQGVQGDVSQLTQTADGLTVTVGNLQGDVSQLTQDVSGFQQAVTNLEGDMSQVNQTVAGFEQKVTDAEGNIAQLSQTVSGFQQKVTDIEGNVSQLTQTSQSLTSRIEAIESNPAEGRGENLITDVNISNITTTTQTESNMLTHWKVPTSTAITDPAADKPNRRTIYSPKDNSMDSKSMFILNKEPDGKYTIEFDYWSDFAMNTNTFATVSHAPSLTGAVDSIVSVTGQDFAEAEKVGSWNRVKKAFTLPAQYINNGYLIVSTWTSNTGIQIYRDFDLYGNVDTAATVSSQITQLANNINLRVQKGDVINQINISPESILIAGEKIRITGQTTIDNAVIKDAMIANLSASKLTAGTIDASNINVINLNASNITSGSMNVSRLTGNTASFVQTNWNGVNSSVSITSTGLNTYNSDGTVSSRMNGVGHTFFYKNTSMGIIGTGNWVGDETYRGLSFFLEREADYMAWSFASSTEENVYNTRLSWHKTDAKVGRRGFTFGDAVTVPHSEVLYLRTISTTGYVNDETRRLRIVNMGDISFTGTTEKIAIGIFRGDDGGRLFLGSQMIGMASKAGGLYVSDTSKGQGYVFSASIYNRTSSTAANVVISSNGILARSTSATKYKLNIEEVDESRFEKILDIKPKSWHDRWEAEEKARVKSLKAEGVEVDDYEPIIRRYTGAIAEDFVQLGLTEFVVYDDEGEVEGLQYERAWLYLLPIIKKMKAEAAEEKSKRESLEMRLSAIEQMLQA